jgi:hypothetical protein
VRVEEAREPLRVITFQPPADPRVRAFLDALAVAVAARLLRELGDGADLRVVRLEADSSRQKGAA